MMMSKPKEWHRNVKYCAWGLLLFVLWLSLHTVVLAENEGSIGPKESTVSLESTASAETHSTKMGDANSDQTIKVIKDDVRYAIDFSYLSTVVPKSIAWLYQPNTTINQPVMYGDNPDYYLRRQFNDRISQYGAIFMKDEEPPDFSAPVITIYGVNSTDNSMFGTLSFYREEAYYEENPTLYLITPEGDYQLDIFAGIRTKHTDTETWKVSDESTVAFLLDDLPGILEKSFITPNPSSLPIEGDAWAVLSTESYEKQGSRFVIYARKRPIEYTATRMAYANQVDMDSRATLNGYASVENVGEWMLYAQNDPIWNKLVFEIQTSSRKRAFGDGGCGPTAVAMAIVNLVEKEELSKISGFASSPLGFRFCKCSVNDYWCSSRHLTYQITETDEYVRYFPLVIASFATGNNIWNVQGRGDRFGTNMSYLEKLCEIYDITLTKTYQISEALTFLQNDNTIAVACTSGYGSPFTTASHFVVLADVDDEYFYVLDSFRRDDYQALDRNNFLEIISPGLLRVRLENAGQSSIRPIYLMQRNTGS